jgi:hypothetical protein
VQHGRRTFANTLKYISITTSANFGNMVSMALATPISTDNVDAERVARAQRWDVVEVRRFMVVFGLISTVVDLLTFFVLLRVFDANRTGGVASAENTRAGPAQRAEQPTPVDDRRRRGLRGRRPVRRAVRQSLRLRRPALESARRHGRNRGRPHPRHGVCEALVLS